MLATLNIFSENFRVDRQYKCVNQSSQLITLRVQKNLNLKSPLRLGQ